jgi:hypothetical protein
LKDRGNDAEATPLSEYRILMKMKGIPDKGEPTQTRFTIAVAG